MKSSQLELKFSWNFIVLLIGLTILTLLFAFAPPITSSATSDLVINEIMVSNNSFLRDPEYNNYSGWIEIYNSGSSAIDLSGYTLTDDLTVPGKWVIGAVTINPGTFQTFWTDDRNSGNHTNFKLRHRGEDVGLFNPSAELVDGFSFGEQVGNVSFGRETDGGATWVYFQEPTPGAANTTIGLPDTDQAGEPLFDFGGGFYTSPFTLTITAPSVNALVTYTLDGTEPTASSPAVSGGISISETTVVRARAFEDGLLNGPIVTNSYLLNEGTTLPVVSIVTDPGNFFDDYYGIYVVGQNGIPGDCSETPANYYQDWQRPLSLEFFETDGTPGFKFDGKVEIQGSCSRRWPIKGLDIELAHQYGMNEFQYDLFPGNEINGYKALLLRPSGQDQKSTLFRDALIQTLIQGEMDIDNQASRASVVFINGQYWGIHNIREKLNIDYIETHFGEEDVDLIKRDHDAFEIKEGDDIAYFALENFVRDNDLSIPENYAYVADRVDLDEFMNYQIIEIYAAQTDWPHNNIRLWRPRRELGQWRWMLFDLDYSFVQDSRLMFYFATYPDAGYEWSTLFMSKLLENEGFRNEFIQRMAGHINITFAPTRVIYFIDEFEETIAAEIPHHFERWGAPSMTDWVSNVDQLRSFAQARRPFLRSNLITYFSNHNLTISGMHNLTVNTGSGGKVMVSGFEAPQPFYSGPYYADIPIRLEAVPDPGYQFVEWQELGITAAETFITLSADQTVTAVFEPSGLPPQIVINEIHYNPSATQGLDDDYEFLELVNNSANVEDLSGYTMADGVDFTFPNGISIGPGEYLLLAKNAGTYSGLSCQVFQWVDSSLSNGGETLQLNDSQGGLIDIVPYVDGGAWPGAADGDGPSLALIDLSLDNSQSQSWKASSEFGGTPCAPNVTPANDEFANAVLISSMPYTTSQYTTGATTAVDDPRPVCGAGAQGKGSVWFQFTPTVDGYLTADTSGSSFDTVLTVYSGSVGSLNSLACDNDSLGRQSQLISIPLVGGMAYHLAVTSYGGDLGLLELNMNFSSSIPAVQNKSLNSGWSLISAYIVPTSPALESIFGGIQSDLLLIKNDIGQIYWPELGINSIGNWQVTDGYQINMRHAGQVDFFGIAVQPGSMPIHLDQGWSLIPYLRNQSLPISDALSSISGSLVLVKNGNGALYWPEFGVNQIGNMQPGEGYQVYMSAGGQLVYP